MDKPRIGQAARKTNKKGKGQHKQDKKVPNTFGREGRGPLDRDEVTSKLIKERHLPMIQVENYDRERSELLCRTNSTLVNRTVMAVRRHVMRDHRNQSNGYDIYDDRRIGIIRFPMIAMMGLKYIRTLVTMYLAILPTVLN